MVSPAQNEGRSGVIGDWSVEKNAVTSGIDSTRSSRSGWMNLRSSTMLVAKTRPISISTSRARLAGKTLTSPSVSIDPSATGITTNGTTARTAVT